MPISQMPTRKLSIKPSLPSAKKGAKTHTHLTRHLLGAASVLGISALISTGLMASPLIMGKAAAQEDVIIVTATKRAEDIQEVPISISAYSGDFLDKSGVTGLQDLSLYAPNFTFAQSSQATNTRIIIRGIGSTGNAGIEPAVGVFIDGIYYPRPGSVIGNLIDLQSAEVLRGPQGTLFGRNTAAGALNLTTRDPSDSFEGHVQVSAGDYDAYAVQGAVSMPFSDNVSGRLAVKYNEREGYGYNLLTSSNIGARDDLNVRGKLKINWNDAATTKIIADYSELNSGGMIVELDPTTASPVFDATMTALFGSAPTTADGFDHVINQDHQDNLSDQQNGLAFDSSFEIGDYTLRSITSFRSWEAHYFESALRLTGDVLPRVSDYYTDTFSQEIQLISPDDGPFKYVAGLFFYDEDYKISEDFNAGAQACIPVVFALAGATVAGQCAALPQTPAVDSDFDQSLQSSAVFAQGTYEINPQWSVTVGGRFTNDEKKGSFLLTTPNPIIGSLFRAAENVPDLVSDDSDFTWLVNASYFPTDDVMFFGTVSTGFKGGGFNSQGAGVALGRANRTFTAETSTNYEFGVKSKLFNKSLTANVTYFHTVLEDFQDRSFDGISFITRNAGKRTQRGVEADINWTPTDSFSVISGVSYLDAEFDSFDVASPLPGSTTPQNLSGRRPHFSPEWQGSIVADYHNQFGSSGMPFFVRGEAQYVGEQNVGGNTNLNPQSIQDAYTLYNLRIGISSANDQWQLTAYGKNLTDEGYCQVKFDQPLGASFGGVDVTNNTVPQRCVLGDPQTYGASLRLNF